MSDYSDKMLLLQLDEYQDILGTALKLAKLDMFDENMKLKLNGEVIEESNIIDYIVNKPDLKYKSEYDNLINTKQKEIFTRISPIKARINNNKKFKLFPIK